MNYKLEERVWWTYAEEDIQKLLESSVFLLNIVRSWGGDLPGGKKEFHDYSFCVFPAAKAYEGFLKKVFLDMGFIDESAYYGKYFRIGKALNPSLEPRLRKKESVYDKITSYCGGKDLADALWNAWKEGRNSVTHWFPNEKNSISFGEAQERVMQILLAMDRLFSGCKLNVRM